MWCRFIPTRGLTAHPLSHDMRRFVLFSLLLMCVASSSDAQTGASSVPNDSLFRRARRMVSEGNGAAGRAMVDSLLKKAEEGTTAYGDALFWRGALAETAADAERDYRRVIVEYPLSDYADDALLAIVELEQARGDRAGALAHLQRFVREHPVSPARGIAALAAARLAFDQRDTKTGCAMITDARASAPTSDVELRNQIDYFGSRCTGATNTDAAVAQSATQSVTPSRDSTPVASKKTAANGPTKVTTQPTASAPKGVPAKPATKERITPPPVAESTTSTPAPPSASKPKGIYTIQLAAYNTRADAEQLVKKLEARGVVARVSGTMKPFRVRLDFYPTRQAAQDEVASLKRRGIIGFVTTEERAPEGRFP
jgi:cell division septation protein DedD